MNATTEIETLKKEIEELKHQLEMRARVNQELRWQLQEKEREIDLLKNGDNC